MQTRAKKVMREVSNPLTYRSHIADSFASQMLLFMKNNEKKERESRKKAEKEAMDRVQKEEAMREAKRAARKLNFLITQTELYSHFIGDKVKSQSSLSSVAMQPLTLLHCLSKRSGGFDGHCWIDSCASDSEKRFSSRCHRR